MYITVPILIRRSLLRFKRQPDLAESQRTDEPSFPLSPCWPLLYSLHEGRWKRCPMQSQWDWLSKDKFVREKQSVEVYCSLCRNRRHAHPWQGAGCFQSVGTGLIDSGGFSRPSWDKPWRTLMIDEAVKASRPDVGSSRLNNH